MRTTVDIPERLYEALEHRSANEGSPIESLIVRALEEIYAEREQRKGRMVTGPMVRGSGNLGPRFPVDENPHALIIG